MADRVGDPADGRLLAVDRLAEIAAAGGDLERTPLTSPQTPGVADVLRALIAKEDRRAVHLSGRLCSHYCVPVLSGYTSL